VVAILLFAVGAGISLYEGIHHVLHPAPLGSPLINYLVLGLAIIFESFSLYFAAREFNRVKGDKGYFEAVRQSKDPNLFVVLFEDIAAMLGLIVALIGIWLGHMIGNPYFDGAASILIGTILAGVAIWLAYETKGLLIGESAETEIVHDIREMARKTNGIKHVNEVLTMHMGPEYILVNLSADFADDVSASDVEAGIENLGKQIKATHPRVKRVFVEAAGRKIA
jgi:divalent metal cation (Fe/Co/Zn/Cd) transporter